jgi:iron complex transport system substrate-binding protein
MKVWKVFCSLLLGLVFLVTGTAISEQVDRQWNAGVLDFRVAVGNDKKNPSANTTDYRRIISLAPSLTEVLFALGLGDRVVGVTRYCDYPAEALQKPKVGGYIDPNYEAMISLEPDLVVMLVEHEEPLSFMRQRGIDVLVNDHRTLSGIRTSIIDICRTCGCTEPARALLSKIDGTVARVRKKTAGLHRPRVLIAVGRNPEVKELGDVYIAGRGGFFDEMIELAGGTNAYTDEKVKYPKVSREGILTMNPEVIVDIVPDAQGKPQFQARLKQQWNAVSRVKAVRDGRVHILTEEYAVIPGPRYGRIVADLAKILHPEIDWEK